MLLSVLSSGAPVAPVTGVVGARESPLLGSVAAMASCGLDCTSDAGRMGASLWVQKVLVRPGSSFPAKDCLAWYTRGVTGSWRLTYGGWGQTHAVQLMHVTFAYAAESAVIRFGH